MRNLPPARGAALVVGATLLLGCVAASPALAATGSSASEGGSAFHRTATYPVFQNVPAGVDPADATAAEISGVTDDGNTVIYTDAPGKRIGFLDITNVNKPVGAGSIALSELGHADDQPTSVAVYGDYVLVVVDQSGGDFVNPSGRLDVIRISDRTRITSIDLDGQPDSISISKDGAYAAIAIENQRNEEVTPEGGEEGDLPQLPAGFVQVIDLSANPTDWTATPVPFVNPDGSALASFVDAGLDSPTDPEPEYVTINSKNQLAVTLQENNGIVLLDLATREITDVFSAGSVSVSGIDTKKDKVIDLTGSITDVPREPDSIAWVDDTHLATANEGDWKGGSRGWTIFDATTGDVAWDAGNTIEHLAVAHGLYNDDRAGKKGTEPEGLAIAEFDGTTYGFVASERSNFVAVYDLSNPVEPEFQQLVFATNGPEGLLPVPSRDLLVVSSETDDASIGVRASVAVFQMGDGTEGQPTIVSDDVDGSPIGWVALGALSAKPGDSSHIYTASDSALSPSTIFSVDVTGTETGAPATIDDSIVVTENGAPAVFDIEGLHAREQGGFWLASEGATGAANTLYRTDDAGAVLESVALPTEISDHISKWGYEGVTAITDADGNEQVYVAIQRPLWTDPADQTSEVDGDGVTRIGRYDVTSKTWSWFGYQLEATGTAGDWMGLSEIVAVDDETLAVIERDKLNGPNAAIKRIYTVQIPSTDPAAGTLPILEKTLAYDVLGDLQNTNGWTQEKLEGLTIGADGNVYAVTDNDGLKDATGETVFMNLGTADDIFGTDDETPTPEPTTPTPTTPPTTVPTTTPTTAPTTAPPAATPTVTVDDADGKIAAGSALPLSGTGFAANTRLTVTLHSTPVELGVVMSKASGAFTTSFTVPKNAEAGTHRVVVTAPNGVSAEATVTIVAAGSAAALASTGVAGAGVWLGGALALLLAGSGTLVIHRRRIQS
jgi:Esterase-like activity of phytase